MPEEYKIQYVEKPTDEMWAAIGGGINAFNLQHAGAEHYQRLCYALTAPDGTVAGGLIGATFWGWFNIELLIVREELRGQGYGGRILEMAEEEARRRGVQHAYLDTFSFQAADFYTRRGYRAFGELPDFPTGHTRYFMTKALD